MKQKEPEPPGKRGHRKSNKSTPNSIEIQILEFHKSKHFVRQQRRRKIDDCLLARILWGLKPTTKPTSVIIRTSEILKLVRSGKIESHYKSLNRDLVLVIDGYELITCIKTDTNSYCTSSSIQEIFFLYIKP